MRTLLGTTATIVLAAFATAASAQNIKLGPSAELQSQTVDVKNAGSGVVEVDFVKETDGTATFGTASGTYKLTTMDDAFFGPENAANVLPSNGSPSQTLTYGPDSAGDQLSCTVSWGSLSLTGALYGTCKPTSVIGTTAFTTAFKVGTAETATLTIGGMSPAGLLVAPGRSDLAGVLSGVISGASGPQCHQITVCD